MMVVDGYTQRTNDFEAKDTQLVFVGLGGAKKGKEYAKNLKIGDLVLDQKRQSYALCGFKDSGWVDLLSDSKGRQLSSEASKKGFKISLIGVGNKTQLGGVAIFDSSANLHYLYRCTTSYDYPEVDELLTHCK
jgi:hypothetical protein